MTAMLDPHVEEARHAMNDAIRDAMYGKHVGLLKRMFLIAFIMMIWINKECAAAFYYILILIVSGTLSHSMSYQVY